MKRLIINKKGLSGVVTAVLLIALTMAMIGTVWVVVRNLVNNQIESAGSCLDIIGKVSINNDYTCYNSTSKELRLSIDIGDIGIDSLLVGVYGGGMAKTLTLTNDTSTIPNLVTYPGRSTSVKLPGENAGLSYLFNLSAEGFSGAPDSIEIAPKIGGTQCDKSDSLNQIDDCALFIT